MKESQFPQPPVELLQGFREGDPLAIHEVVTIVLPSLLRWAWGRYPSLAPDDVQDVVHQVVAEICHHHQRYDSERGVSFTTYVIGLLKLRLTDLYATQQQIDQNEEVGPDVYEKLSELPYNDTGPVDEDTRLARAEFFQQVNGHLEPIEQEMLELMRQGYKKTADFASVLARYGPVESVENDVKNAKARLLRKLTLIRSSLGYTLEDLL